MDSIAEIVKNLLVIIIVTSFLELMLPEGALKPFVRFAIGLFIIITVLNPILSFVFDKDTFEISWWDDGSVQHQEQLIDKAGQNLNQEISQTGHQGLREKIEGQISALILLVPGVKASRTRVELDDQGGITGIEITVFPESIKSDERSMETAALGERQLLEKNQAEAIRLKIRELLKNLYGFEKIRIDVVFEGG